MKADQLQDLLNKKLEERSLSMVSIDLENSGDKIHIDSIETKEGFRRQGYGRKAMNTLTDLADEFNVRLSLEVAGDEDEDDDDSPDGLPGFWILVSFYESCGFYYAGEAVMGYSPNTSS